MIFRLMYGLAIRFYHSAIVLASLWNPKAKAWIRGRKNWQNKLTSIVPDRGTVWFHASSLGEYEMARPIIRSVKSQNANVNILVSFFSPSGFEHFKNDGNVSGVFYLPLDTHTNARKLLEIVRPKAVIFIKYEFWPNLLSQILDQKIPLFFVGVTFRRDQWFWKIPGNPVLKILSGSTSIMVQNIQSLQIARSYGLKSNIVFTGDTRFDRALEISKSRYDEKKIENFCKSQYTIVAGSSWPADERRFIPLIHKNPEWRWIIAPHDISPKNVKRLTNQLGLSFTLFTEENSINSTCRVLVVDTIGHLARLYRYGNVALIGGAFGTGLHNILEALVYGIPVLFGPNYRKFWEAEEAIQQAFGHSYNTTEELESHLHAYASENLRAETEKRIQLWFHQYTHATTKVTQLLSKSIF
ncbi:MAG: 3-deoxy-D-manno-octulosonic acid transferase [Thermaurantimonas sp.]